MNDKIINADVLEGLADLEKHSIRVELAITSPPYNIKKDYAEHDDHLAYDEYLDWMGSVWKATYQVLTHGGRLCINVGENKRSNVTTPPYAAFINQCIGMGMLYRGTIIWNKNSAANHCAWGSWLSPSNPHIVPRHEYILVFSKNTHILSGHVPDRRKIDKDDFMECTRSVWNIGTESAKKIGHPCPFPVELPRRLIKFYSYPGNTVLDMFAGSGTTAVAAAELGRGYILIEKSGAYCEIAKARLA